MDNLGAMKALVSDHERAAFDGFREQARVNYGLTRLTDNLVLSMQIGSGDPGKFKPYIDKYGIKKIESGSYVDAFGKESTFSSRTSVAMALPSLF